MLNSYSFSLILGFSFLIFLCSYGFCFSVFFFVVVVFFPSYTDSFLFLFFFFFFFKSGY